MASLAIPQIEPRLNPDREALLARLLPIPHSPESMAGIPYYDEEFAMAQSDAHRKNIYFLGGLLDRIAAAAGLRGVSDYPIWYWIPEEDRQTALYPDYALTANASIQALTAKDLLWVLEVVTTSKPAKMHKDTVRMRDYNALHGVPEFVLLFPEPEDSRSVVWHRYDASTEAYQVVTLPADRRYRSQAIPGLEIEVLEPSAWTAGRKVRVYYQGQEFRDAQVEAQAREAAERRAQQERQARETAERQAQHAQQAQKAAERRVEQLLARLKQAGLEP
jgi:Uma2 family endonuclease